MNERELEPDEPGWGDPVPQHRGRISKSEERRQAGTPTTLQGNIDTAIDKIHHTANEPRAQGHAIRWLVSRYPISAAVAAIIATELRMGDA
jgi:hypothetical protein